MTIDKIVIKRKEGIKTYQSWIIYNCNDRIISVEKKEISFSMRKQRQRKFYAIARAERRSARRLIKTVHHRQIFSPGK